MARCRRNVDNFLEACRKIGVDEVRNFINYLPLLISFEEVCASLSLRVYYTCMRHAVIISVQRHGTCWHGGYFHIERLSLIRCFCFFFNKWWCGKRIMIVILLYDRSCVLHRRVASKIGYLVRKFILYKAQWYQLTILSSSVVLRSIEPAWWTVGQKNLSHTICNRTSVYIVTNASAI